MILRPSSLFVVLSLASAKLPAQGGQVDLKAEEAAIRAIISAGQSADGHELTSDAVVWTGAYKRPNIGSRRSEAFPEAAIGKRKNSKNTVKVERIEVAASGDMAWEFSHGTLDYDVDGPPVSHVSLEQGILRTWKKLNGEWKIAAIFSRPLDWPLSPPK
jgi:ketosteroid isomerase-like protein